MTEPHADDSIYLIPIRMRSMLRLLLILCMVINSFTAQAMTYDDGPYFFRYKASVTDKPIIEDNGDIDSKAVNASFIGGVGVAFSEQLPLKPDWEDDAWQVETGSLPNGITFNAATKTFEGIPLETATDITTTLYGYDTLQNRVARANITFNIHVLPENSLKVDLYAHTGRYFNKDLSLPAGVVINRWEELISAPPGIDFNGRYVDGSPTEAGHYSILNIGYDYSGKAIFSYYGSMVVADNLEFATVADNLKEISWYYGYTWWNLQAAPRVKRSVDNPSKVKYSVEFQGNGGWPGNLTDSTIGLAGYKYISGSVTDYFDQSVIRYKAEDIDGAVGYSNWFKIGSLGPEGICTPIHGAKSIKLNGVVSDTFNGTGYKIPTSHDASTKDYKLVSGSLPQGLSLNPTTGLISGIPVTEEIQQGLMVDVSFPGNSTAEIVHCGPFDLHIAAAKIDLMADGAKAQYRVNETLDVNIVPTGGLIAPYTISLNEGASLPSTVSFDATSGKLSGLLAAAGTYSAIVTLTNGDGVTKSLPLSFSVHNPLVISNVPALSSIARYDRQDSLFSAEYEEDNVIGTASLSVTGGPLPQGLYLDPTLGIVGGGTTLPEMAYGPFRIRLTDGSGEFTETNDFHIQVTPRTPLDVESLVSPVFQTNLYGGAKPFSVAQAPLAEEQLPLNYTLHGPALPEGLSFNPSNGTITGTARKVQTLSGYSVTVLEQSPDNLSITSSPFSVVVTEPPPIGNVVSYGKVLGNVNGPQVTSGALKNRLASVATSLVGGVDGVTFQSYSPTIPGMSIDPTTGEFQGIPTSEFDGTITVSFIDANGRSGTLSVPVNIYPYPQLTAQERYNLPRLAKAEQFEIKAMPNSGFYSGIQWSLAANSNPLPAGLTLDKNGRIVGSTSASVGTTVNLVLEAKSKANGLTVTQPFTLAVIERLPITLEMPTTISKTYFNGASGKVTSRDYLAISNHLKGSFVAPVTYAFNKRTAPDWLIVNASTGLISGTPLEPGDWDVEFSATDAEGARATGSAKIRATYDKFVVSTPNSQSKSVRISETFATDQQTVTNVVRPFSYVPTNMPNSITVDQASGAFKGSFSSTGTYRWSFNILDVHGRTLGSSSHITARAIAPLQLPEITKNQAARRFSPDQPVNVQFPDTRFNIGEVSYLIEGDAPGSLYYKFVSPTDGLAYYLRYENGSYVGRLDQQPNETVEQAEFRLAPDHLIFDKETMTLKGIPSKAGTFGLKLVAWDNHGDDYLDPTDPTRIAYNSAERSFTLTVADAHDLIISNSQASEQLYRYTSQPALKTTVQNAAYGRAPSWQMISGTLPQNITGATGSSTLGYSGYAENIGTFSNIVWVARDAAGREITSSPVSFTVGARQTMALTTSTANPRPMIVFDTDANMTVSAKNTAYGSNPGKANWTVTGQNNLPPGVTFTIEDAGVTFTGKSDVIGVYSGIQVRGQDALGASATINLTFNVMSSPAPIGLLVYNIKSKVGYPVLMKTPLAQAALSTSNTYGNIRFYSYDLPNDLSLNQTDGGISGMFNEAMVKTFDIYVTDDTDRVTSKPVTVDIIPNVRVIAPTRFTAVQGTVFNGSVSTDYVLGNVKYEKGTGNWPDGFDVNPTTGAIRAIDALNNNANRVVAAEGEYADLTIRAIDTFVIDGVTYTDNQLSSPFTIKVDPTTADPDIKDPSGLKVILGTQNLAITNWKPTVHEKGTTRNWAFAGTVYEPSHDISQYGLSFNKSTGIISGVAHTPFIIRDFRVTVTSQRGVSDVTSPFWIGVAPSGNISGKAGQTSNFALRKGDTLNVPAADWINTIGNLTFTNSGLSGVVVTSTGTLTNSTQTSGWAVRSNVAITRTARDEFNRQGSFVIYLTISEKLTVSPLATRYVPGATTNLYPPLVSGQLGQISFGSSNIPSFLSIDSNSGIISGVVPDGTDERISFDVTVTDSFDGAVATAPITLIPASTQGYRFWKVDFQPGTSGWSEILEIQLFDENGTNVVQPDFANGQLILKSSPPQFATNLNWGKIAGIADGNLTTNGIYYGVRPDASGRAFISFEFATPANIQSATVYNHQNVGYRSRNHIVYSSDDGVNWVEMYRGATGTAYNPVDIIK